ncbi:MULTISPECIES: GNAT family N-acetyltransferase [unclassified Granulicatella]|uniref:GNAT family N-acetyltransferase n=1 Tax=unclassified Granulicatella TaxID=2630493 RepID=UPI0010742C85|nr:MULTISPECIES: GNAT family N-acetyltransferase [unclassified Granulicatella]MBF0779943.1 GNAT family N-acetyltransferase [Granulicatella sp. 19428wC4_WM01]TFU95960.1 GNAT family N-acetyltransferase [Granulicatella sp. WM01]
MCVDIKECALNQVELLQQVCQETFKDTFGEFNTPEDMENHLQNAYTIEKLTNSLQNEKTWVYLIYKDEQVAGYLKLNCDDAQSEPMGEDTLEIECIYIRMPFKRQGLGQLLFNHAVNKAKELGKTKIWLGVWEYNQPAIAFYQSLGFKQNGSHSFWVGQDEQIDYIMEKILD